MGRRGPPPTPTALKLVKGNPGKRALNPREPKASGKHGAPPKFLGTIGKATWRRVSRMLTGMNLESESDRIALELVCAAYEEWRELARLIEEHGRTYTHTTAEGSELVKARPEIAMLSDAARRLHRMLLEFGLTPSARSRVKAGEPEMKDPMEDFLKRGRA